MTNADALAALQTYYDNSNPTPDDEFKLADRSLQRFTMSYILWRKYDEQKRN